MHVREYALFPTRLVAVRFDDVDGLNHDLYDLFNSTEFSEGFDMHPDSLNLLARAASCPPIARLRGMFLDGLSLWLRAEGVRGEMDVEMVMFSSLSETGGFSQVHNHNADVVGIYYARTAEYDRPDIVIPDPDGEYDYFAAEDGALTLHDPRFNANLAAVRVSDYVRVFPRPGLMLLFPGYLWHSVTPHLGEFRRLALSVNFRLTWKSAAVAERVSLSIE